MQTLCDNTPFQGYTVAPMSKQQLDDIRINGSTYHIGFDGCMRIWVKDGSVGPTPTTPPTISLSSPQSGIYENGDSVGPITLNTTVTVGTNPVTAIDYFNGATNIYTGMDLITTDTGPFTTNQTWHATATDGALSGISNNVSITFLSRFYYGMDANTTLDEAGIKALEHNELKSTYTGVYALESVLGNYKYFARPVAIGQPSDPTVDFKDNDTGFAIPFQLQGTVSVTNTLGYTENYYVYRSVNILGSSLNIQIQP